MPIKAKEIQLTNWTAQPIHQTFAAADAEIRRIAQTMALDDHDRRINFVIAFEDDRRYLGYLRIGHAHATMPGPILGPHVRDFLEILGGLRKPAHLEHGEYREQLKALEARKPGTITTCRTWLEHYQFGDS